MDRGTKVQADVLKEFGNGKREAEGGVFMSGLRKLDSKDFTCALDIWKNFHVWMAFQMRLANLKAGADCYENVAKKRLFKACPIVRGWNCKKDEKQYQWENGQVTLLRSIHFLQNFSAET